MVQQAKISTNQTNKRRMIGGTCMVGRYGKSHCHSPIDFLTDPGLRSKITVVVIIGSHMVKKTQMLEPLR